MRHGIRGAWRIGALTSLIVGVLGAPHAGRAAQHRHTPTAVTPQAGRDAAATGPSHEVSDDEPSDRTVHLISINASINPATADFIHEAITTAQREGAQALIIQLDTPGGLLESTKVIVKDMLGSPVPIIIYIAPSGAGAASAGVFITLAANIAAMAPGTNIGAAHPVSAGGGDIGKDMREKVENFTASMSKSIAQERGRNVEWAEQAVRQSVSITEQEALKLNVVDVVASSVEELLRQADGKQVTINNVTHKLAVGGAQIVRRDMRLKQKVLNVLADPNVAYLLMMAGLLGLYVRLTHPGVIFPGVAGGICLLLGLTALQVLPINYSGLALIGLGLALLIAELFLPSFGTLGVGGIVAFVLGSLLLFDTSESDLTLNPYIVYAAAATFGTFTFIVGYLVVRSQWQQPVLGREGLLGKVGDVRQRITPDTPGKVFVYGEYWNAVASEAIDIGERVEVSRVDGLRLTVRRLSSGRLAGIEPAVGLR